MGLAGSPLDRRVREARDVLQSWNSLSPHSMGTMASLLLTPEWFFKTQAISPTVMHTRQSLGPYLEPLRADAPVLM